MIGSFYTLLLLRQPAPPTPVNGPSGGAAWLRGYVPKFDTRKPAKRRRNKRDEILFLT